MHKVTGSDILCEVCGAQVDDYGCLGYLSSRHASAEVERLKKRVTELERELHELRARFL